MFKKNHTVGALGLTLAASLAWMCGCAAPTAPETKPLTSRSASSVPGQRNGLAADEQSGGSDGADSAADQVGDNASGSDSSSPAGQGGGGDPWGQGGGGDPWGDPGGGGGGDPWGGGGGDPWGDPGGGGGDPWGDPGGDPWGGGGGDPWGDPGGDPWGGGGGQCVPAVTCANNVCQCAAGINAGRTCTAATCNQLCMICN
ncbi:MAG: hypothetical protein R3B36_27515 [Polyangiaceae bacterium]